MSEAPSSEDAAYKAWLAKHGVQESNDYDTYGAFQAGLVPDERGHLNDTFKLLNHITVSDEAHAARAPGAPAVGKWVGDNKKGWTFYAAPINVHNAGGVKPLQEYFKKYESESKLVLPIGKASGGMVVSSKADRGKLI